MSKSDTIGENYYKAVNTLERVCTSLFWLLSALSLLILAIQGTRYSAYADFAQALFLALSIVNLLLSLSQRYYFFPRAEEARRRFLFSESYGNGTSFDTAPGYYNNSESDPIRRLSASIMESAFFTEKLAKAMLIQVRILNLSYIFVFTLLAFSRSVELSYVGLAGQVIFSESVLQHWIRLEFLRSKSAKAFDRLHDLFAFNKQVWKKSAPPRALEQISNYEAAKSTACIAIPQVLFEKLNPKISAEWENMRVKVGF